MSRFFAFIIMFSGLSCLAVTQDATSYQGVLAECQQEKTFSKISVFEISKGIGQIDIQTHSSDTLKISYTGLDLEAAKKFTISVTDHSFKLTPTEPFEIKDKKLYFKKGEAYDISDFHITITLPKKSTIDLNIESGDVTIKNSLENGAKVNFSGAGNLTADEIKGPSIKVDMRGSGQFDCKKVEAKSFVIKISGSGSIETETGKAEVADININGAGDVDLGTVNIKALTASIQGAGSVKSEGVVQDVTASISGTGNIKVKKAEGKIEKSILGAGSIKIGS